LAAKNARNGVDVARDQVAGHVEQLATTAFSAK